MQFTRRHRFNAFLVATVVAMLYYLCSDQYVWKDFDVLKSTEMSATLHPTYTKQDVLVPINSKGSIMQLHGWLMLPVTVGSKKLSVVILSHGMGAQKDMGLEQYGQRFVEAGFAAFIFDYRYFGGSTQFESIRIRNYINPWNHVVDIKTVVKVVHSGALGAAVDGGSIALWGTSFAGGHVLKVAQDLGPSIIRCVISQVPHLDGRLASRRGIVQRGVLGTLRVAVLAAADVVSQTLGLPPVYVKIAGSSSEVAYMMLSAEQLALYFSKHPAQYLGGWRNLAPAGTLGILSLYNPIDFAAEVRVPVLYIGGTEDALCPVELVRSAANRTPNAELLEINTSHFGIYSGEPLQRAMQAMEGFLLKHLA